MKATGSARFRQSSHVAGATGREAISAIIVLMRPKEEVTDMGRGNRCERFIKEFNQDAIESYGVSFGFVIKQSLGVMDSWGQVFLFVEVAEGANAPSEELMLPVIMFDDEESEADTVERICELFELDETVARERLKKADLFGQQVLDK
jgi:hypothetical protein